MEDKQQEMEELRDQLSKNYDEGKEMSAYKKGIYDTLDWLLGDSDKPEIN